MTNSITAKVLNMANSAYFGMFPHKEGDNFFDREQFWLHSIACGYLGKIIADHVKFYEPDKAFIACLLHDIEKVVVDSYFEEEYKDVVSTARAEKISYYEADKAVLGSEHCEIGISWVRSGIFLRSY